MIANSTQLQETRLEPEAYATDSDEGVVFNPLSALHSLRRCWKAALPIALVGSCVLAFLAWKLIVPNHSAVASLRLEANTTPLLFQTADQIYGGRSFSVYKSTQAQLLRTPLVLSTALRDERVSGLKTVREQADPVRWLQEELNVEFPGDGEIMEVSIGTVSPTDCVALVEAVVRSYLDEVVLEERNNRLERLDTLRAAREKKQAIVRSLRTELKEMVSEHGAGDAESLTLEQQAKLQQFGSMLTNLHTTEFQLLQAEGELKVLQTRFAASGQKWSEDDISAGTSSAGQAGEDEGDIVLPHEIYSPEVLKAQSRVTELDSRISAAKARYGRNHPETQSLERQKVILDRLLQDRIDYEMERIAWQRRLEGDETFVGIDDPLKTAIAATEAKIESLSYQQGVLVEKIGALENSFRQLGRSSIDLEFQRNEIATSEETLKTISAEIEKTMIELEQRSSIDLIAMPTESSPPQLKKRLTATGGLAIVGFVLPFVFFGGWDLARRNVDSADSASSALAVSTLGTVPRVSQRLMDVPSTKLSLRGQKKRAELIESLDAAARMVLHQSRTMGHSVFMITSAVAGEGKTTTACRLAESLARAGKRVVIVDFDLRRPKVHRHFDVRRAPGVKEMLYLGADLDQMLQSSRDPDLKVLAAGNHGVKLHEGASESELDPFFESLRSEFDIVIVDSCPVLPVVDARIVGAYCDGVILTLMRDRSRLKAASKACGYLREFGAKLIGTIVIGESSTYYQDEYYCVPASDHLVEAN
ncbi:MAG: AAA family ATPase [Planctomycetota bacterium]